jgi:hypothetical protein
VQPGQGLEALAILIAPHVGGLWRWELIDAEGVSIVNGFAADQGHAMQSARQGLDADVNPRKV